MPEEEYVWLPREEILHFEEISSLVDVFGDLGVDKVRLTGGEPLLRRNLDRLIRLLAASRPRDWHHHQWCPAAAGPRRRAAGLPRQSALDTCFRAVPRGLSGVRRTPGC
jgi:hypothetical protein